MSIIKMNRTYFYEDIKSDATLLSNHYPSILTKTILGKSHDGRDLLMLQLGNAKKTIILTAGVHGRESINPIVLMRILEYYCSQYEKMDYLKCYSFCIIPLLNPDGYTIALNGYDSILDPALREAAKKKGIPYPEWKYNARGIDLNRNFPSQSWSASSGSDFPASENETKALIQVFHQQPSIGYIDYHSRGETIYYYRNSMGKGYNQTQQQLALRLSQQTGYSLVSPADEIDSKDVGGNTVHYYSEYKNKPAITIETLKDQESFPLSIHLQEVTFLRLYTTPLVFTNIMN